MGKKGTESNQYKENRVLSPSYRKEKKSNATSPPKRKIRQIQHLEYLRFLVTPNAKCDTEILKLIAISKMGSLLED